LKKLHLGHIFILALVSITSYSCAPKAILNLDSERQSLINFAQDQIGSPYEYAGTKPQGFDCSGFTSYVYNNALDLQLERTAKGQSKMGKSIKLKEAEAGDLIFFSKSGKINHVAIIENVSINAVWVIHATSSKGVIRENVLNSPYWKNKIAFCRSLF